MRSLLGRFHRPFARGTEEQLLMLNNLGDGSTLSLDFTTGVLDPRLTFTRLSNATFINSSGQVQWADSNLAVNSAFGGTSPGTGWTTNGSGSMSSNAGTFTAQVTSAATAFLSRIIAVSSGLRYSASVNVTTIIGTINYNEVITIGGTLSSAKFYRNGVEVGTNGNGVAQAQTGLITVIWTCGGTNTIRFGIGASGTNHTNVTVALDSPRVVPGEVTQATYFASTTTAEYHAPRFDYDPTSIGTPRGLLIEGSATNLFLNSSLDSSGTTTPANWSRGFSGSTVASVNSTVFPGMKAWSISATASGQRDWLTPTVAISVAANTTYTVSVYVESQTGTLGPSGLFAYFDAIPAGATSTGISNPVVGRNTCTLTVGATAGTATFRIGLGTSGGGGVTSNAQVTFSHLQIEVGSGASSYIPTGASTGNRAADVCYADNISSWYTQGIGTMLFVGRPIQSVTRNYLGFSTGTNPPRLLLYGSNATEVALYLENSTAANLIFPSGSTTLGSVNRMAASFEQAGYSCVLNGGTVGTSTTASPAMPTSGINRMNIGMRNDQFNQFYGHVVQVKYWPYRLPNAQLQSITT